MRETKEERPDKKNTNPNRNLFFWFMLVLIFILGAILLSGRLLPVQAQGDSTPIPSTNPTIIALENVIATQQIQIDEQSRGLKNEIEDRERAILDWQWKWGIVGALVGAVGTILATIGINTVTNFKKRIQEIEKDFESQLNTLEKTWDSSLQKKEVEWNTRLQQTYNKLVLRFDLSRLPIYVPKELGAVRLRLEYSGLKPTEYVDLNQVPLNGVIVINIASEEDEINFQKFINSLKPNPQKTAFVLYAPSIKVSNVTIDCYDNLVTANFPSATVTHILAIGRGLQIDPLEEE